MWVKVTQVTQVTQVKFCTWNIKNTLMRHDYEGFRWFWHVIIQKERFDFFVHWLTMVRSRNWPDLWWQISKIRDIQVIGIYDLMKRWRFETYRISSVATAQPQSQKPVFDFNLPWWTFGDLGLTFLHKVSNSIVSRYWKNGGRRARRRFSAIREKPEGWAFFAPFSARVNPRPAGGRLNARSGFSRIAKIRQRAATPGFLPPDRHLFRDYCENCDPRSCKVRSPGQIKNPTTKYLSNRTTAHGGHNVLEKVMKLFEYVKVISAYKTYISDFW